MTSASGLTDAAKSVKQLLTHDQAAIPTWFTHRIGKMTNKVTKKLP
jgi:hypothetical protein